MKKKILRAAALVLIVLAAGCAAYVMNDYPASEDALTYLKDPEDSIDITETGDGMLLDGPGTDTALIFYPGGKVEYTAYAPLLGRLAESGVDCFLVKMPGNLAIFGVDKASGIMTQYDYDHWYIGGHSLGGVMAASFAGKNDLDGLILLAAYPAAEVDERSIEIWGSEDGVLDPQKLAEGDPYFETAPEKVILDGGNHAQFGNYGEQKGDKKALITREEQQAETVKAILAFTEE